MIVWRTGTRSTRRIPAGLRIKSDIPKQGNQQQHGYRTLTIPQHFYSIMNLAFPFPFASGFNVDLFQFEPPSSAAPSTLPPIVCPG
jgi:hypothetical protein